MVVIKLLIANIKAVGVDNIFWRLSKASFFSDRDANKEAKKIKHYPNSKLRQWNSENERGRRLQTTSTAQFPKYKSILEQYLHLKRGSPG